MFLTEEQMRDEESTWWGSGVQDMQARARWEVIVDTAVRKAVNRLDESQSAEPTDHVDDYGNVPAAPDIVRQPAAPHIDWNVLSPEQQRDEETFFHDLVPVTPAPGFSAQPEIDPGGWTPPEIFGWQPPTLGGDIPEMDWGAEGAAEQWEQPWGELGTAEAGPAFKLPWTDDEGQLDLTPGEGKGIFGTPIPDLKGEGGELDLTPGEGSGILGWTPPDFGNISAMLPLMIFAMVSKKED